MISFPTLVVKQTYGLSIPICWDTARLWMHGLGFGFSDVQKDNYDSHHREDVIPLPYRAGLKNRYFDWADVDTHQQIPGYDMTSYKFDQLSECLDFINQNTALEEHIVNRRHICEFLPPNHPEY